MLCLHFVYTDVNACQQASSSINWEHVVEPEEEHIVEPEEISEACKLVGR